MFTNITKMRRRTDADEALLNVHGVQTNSLVKARPVRTDTRYGLFINILWDIRLQRFIHIFGDTKSKCSNRQTRREDKENDQNVT